MSGHTPWREIEHKACVCGEINSRHCPVHADACGLAAERPTPHTENPGCRCGDCNGRPAPAKSCVSVDCWAPDCGCAHLKRHPNSARFHELLELAGQRHDEKQADYGKGEDPFANVRASEDWGVPGWVGTMIRLSDKVKRLQAFAGRGELTGEAADNDFVDIAVYALIAYVLWEQERVA